MIFGHQSAFVAQVSFLRKKLKKEEEVKVLGTSVIKKKINCENLCFLFYFLLPPGIKKGKAGKGILNEAQFFV